MAGTNYSKMFQQTLSKAQQLYKSPIGAANAELNPSAIVAGMKNAYVDPTQVGNDAGLGYDAAIHQDQTNYTNTEGQNAQNLKDIADWYAQVANTQQRGAADNAATLAQQLSGEGDAAHGFLNAIGLGANSGAAGIANAADIASAGLRGIGLAGANFDNNMRGVVSLAGTQAKSNEQTAGTNRLQAIMGQISSDKMNKAAAIAQARDAAQQTLFGQKGDVANLLSNLQGNLFNEKMGVRQERLSELGQLSNQILSTALAGPQINAAKLNNQMTKGDIAARTLANKQVAAQTKAYVKSAKASGGGATWANAPLAVTNGIRGQILQHGGEFLSANGSLKVAPPQVKASLSRMFQELGFKNGPALQREINLMSKTILSPQAVAKWDAKHGTHYGQKKMSPKQQQAWIQQNLANNLANDPTMGPGGADVPTP